MDFHGFPTFLVHFFALHHAFSLGSTSLNALHQVLDVGDLFGDDLEGRAAGGENHENLGGPNTSENSTFLPGIHGIMG